jgi:putative flippase GtrA
MIFELLFQFAQVVAERFREVVPFTIAGLIATGVNYGTLYLLLGVIGVATLIAVSAAFALSTGTNFFLQKFWTFGEKSLHRLPNQLLLFAAASLLGLVVNDVVFWLFDDVTRVGSVVAEIPTTAAVSAVGFFASRFIFTATAVHRAVSATPNNMPRVRDHDLLGPDAYGALLPCGDSSRRFLAATLSCWRGSC